MAESRRTYYGDNTKPLGTYHMVNRNSFEPQRTNNFEIQITDLPAYSSRGYNGTKNGIGKVTKGAATTNVTLSVASFSAPSISISPIEVPYQNNTVKYAGKPSFGDCTVRVNDYIGLDAENALSEWQKQVYNYDTQVIGWAKDYKKIAYVLEYAPDGTFVRQWTLHGCWPSQLNLGEYAHDGNSVKTVDMTITFDWCAPDIPETINTTENK